MPSIHKTAVVFAYHNVGVRCLQVLLARGVEVKLVISHQDNPQEQIWFESVVALCAAHGIPCITPDNANAPDLQETIAQIAPALIFSFYYRHMIPMSILSLAPGGAFNMHGSLLPKYRGRVPVNWAVLHGETECGMTLHEMASKPDAGAIIGQTAVPILPDDTAYEVFGKLTVAAEQTLWHALPALMAGTAQKHPNDLAQGSYFGGRTPEQGRIDWQQSGQQVYNLHRAVAPPYPGAFTDLAGKRLIIGKARLVPPTTYAADEQHTERYLPPGLAVINHAIVGICGDGWQLRIAQLLCDGNVVDAQQLQTLLTQQTLSSSSAGRV